eukprot:c13864_g1_i2 orf=1440-1778(+)
MLRCSRHIHLIPTIPLNRLFHFHTSPIDCSRDELDCSPQCNEGTDIEATHERIIVHLVETFNRPQIYMRIIFFLGRENSVCFEYVKNMPCRNTLINTHPNLCLRLFHQYIHM